MIEPMFLDVREAARAADLDATRIRVACASGALVASDLTPDSARRTWRIEPEHLRQWVRVGAPTYVRKTA